MTPQELLAVYDAKVRGSFADRLPPGWSGERDGPLTRCLTGRGGFVMITGGAEGLSTTELRELIERTIAYFDEHSRWFEWKTYDHDPPALRPLLLERNATPQPHEALLLGEAAPRWRMV